MASQWSFRLSMLAGTVRDQPVKWLISMLAIAVGIGLGLAVHLIHKTALDQFNSGVRQFSGQADLRLMPNAVWIDEAALEQLPGMAGVKGFSPIIELKVQIEGIDQAVDWIGLDIFRAASITPDLIGKPESKVEATQESTSNDPTLSFLGSDRVFVSPSLLRLLPGDAASLTSKQQGKSANWTVSGSLPGTEQGRLLIVSDIASAQWKLGQIGLISRIDLKLNQGITPAAFIEQNNTSLAQYGRLETPEQLKTRGASVSQAYRANLSILAMVALLTGGFLSFSTQMLSVAQRSRQWALLGAVGMRQSEIAKQILFESLASGLVGGLLGLAIGFGLAWSVVQWVGVDLGAGYFQQAAGSVSISLVEFTVFLGLGVGTTALGALLPSQQARRFALNNRLKAGTEEAGLHFVDRSHWGALALLAAGGLCLLIPPYESVPVGGYLAVAFGLFGGISLIGITTRLMLPKPKRLASIPDLAVSRLANTSRILSVGLAGVVAAFALVVAMHVMIYSFRQSLDDWLNQVLPAPVYLSIQDTSDLQDFPHLFQKQLGQLAGLADVEFLAQTPIILDPARPAVQLIARPLTAQTASGRLPMTGPYDTEKPANRVPIWVSEPAANIYKLKVGDTLELPTELGKPLQAQVLGIWRDYARQHGAIAISLGDVDPAQFPSLRTRQAGIWNLENTTAQQLIASIRNLAEQNGLGKDIRLTQPGEIRQISLDIFDRSFAVTYLLEIAAVLIGLFGVATTFSALAMQRKREFALMQALGAKRQTLVKVSIHEGVLASWIAVLLGLCMGLAFAAVLIFQINPQSFHWSMQWNTPWRDLILMMLTLLVFGTLTVALTTLRQAREPGLAQLKEDWS